VDFDIDFMRVVLESAADHLKESRPERENAKVGELVQRLVQAGKLTIDCDCLDAEKGKWAYYVDWEDESASVNVGRSSLLEALERADENVSLVANCG
jgi:hypothetical protein